MTVLNLSGMIPPAVSPLRADGTADLTGVQRLTDHLIEGGSSAIFALGSCGEGPTMPRTVAAQIVTAFVAASDGRVPILAGIGEASTERTVEAAQSAEHAGADALVIMAPMYYDVTDTRAFVRHVEEVARRTELPLILYNIPHLTHHPITPSAVDLVSGIDTVIALKESSADWSVYEPLFRTAKDHGLRVFQGAEALIARSLAEGADGAVPGIANVDPVLLSELVRAGLAGRTAEAATLQAATDERCALYRHGFWLSALKATLAELGLIEPTTGIALPSLDAESRLALIEHLRALGLIAPKAVSAR